MYNECSWVTIVVSLPSKEELVYRSPESVVPREWYLLEVVRLGKAKLAHWWLKLAARRRICALMLCYNSLNHRRFIHI